jgi:hypothetical protein
MNTQHHETTGGALTDVAVLDVMSTPGLMAELLPAFLRHRPAAREWPAAMQERIRFRTECRWGRVEIEPGTLFLINELGGGTREPLSTEVTCRISIYAEVPATRDCEGFHDAEPFIDVAFNAQQASAIPSVGYVRLDEFLLRRIEGVERAYLEWRRILEQAYEKVARRKDAAAGEVRPIELPLRTRRPAAAR